MGRWVLSGVSYVVDQWHSWGIGLHMPEVCLANDIPEEIGYLYSQREMGMSFVVGHREIGYMCWQVEFCMSHIVLHTIPFVLCFIILQNLQLLVAAILQTDAYCHPKICKCLPKLVRRNYTAIICNPQKFIGV